MGAVVPLAAPADEIKVELNDRPLIPEGTYEAAYLHHETARSFGRAPKVYVWFRITRVGSTHGTKLFKAYNVKSINGKPRRNGGFTVGRHYTLLIDLARVLGLKQRPDRLSLASLQPHVLRITVRTVRTNYRQEPLPEFLHYSVIDRLEAIAT